MRVPKAIQNVIESFEKLPGVGPKSAQRLTFYLLHVPQSELDAFALSLTNLKKDTTLCSICYSVGEHDPCDYCTDPKRDRGLVCVVEQALDVLAIEKSGHYHGVYHVLHGKLDPLNNIGPDEIYLRQLLERVRNGSQGSNGTEGTKGIAEVILATNPTMEGEATAMYLSKQLKLINENLKITRIGRGLPVGADLEYADSTTLDRALEGRSDY
jgi:recombination protein RecR